MRVLASHQCGRGSILARNHKWVETVFGFRLSSRVFLPDSPVFRPPLAQSNISTAPNSNLPRREGPHEKQLKLMW